MGEKSTYYDSGSQYTEEDQKLLLDVDGNDRISVEVVNGVKFRGIVKKVETYGSKFRIEGDTEE